MRILMIGQLPKEAGGNYTTGAANVVYELSKQHIDGLEVYMVATNASDKNIQKICAFTHQYIGYRKDIIGILKDLVSHPIRTIREWKHYTNFDHENPLRYAFYKTNIRRAISIVQPDIIHVHSISNVSPTRFAMERKQIPLLLTCHGIFYRGDTEDVKGREVYQGNLPLCDYYTGLTEESRHEFTDILGVPPEKYTIIPNGVDTKKFYYSEEWRTRIRKEMDIKDSTKVFITVASLQERKGQLSFIKILEHLDFDYQYWLVGSGPDKEAIESYVAERYLDEKIKVLGYRNRDELYKYYSAADIYAHPSWKEGQALCEIEAYACGLRTIVNKAVIGTIVGDFTDKCLYYVTDFENVQLRELTEWLQLPTPPRHSRSNYDWRLIMERYRTVYKRIVN